jgi:hypothetical protein
MPANSHLQYLQACLDYISKTPSTDTHTYELLQGKPLFGSQTFIPYRISSAQFTNSGAAIVPGSQIVRFVAVNVDTLDHVIDIQPDDFRPL